MTRPKISMIAAIAEKDRAIGKDNKLLWDIPADLEHFKRITQNHPVIMGSKTFDSLPIKPLPGRINIVLNDKPNYKAEGAVQVSSIDEAIGEAEKTGTREAFIIGGGFVYSQFLPMADKLYLTLVEGEYDADTFFPEYSEFKTIVSEENRESSGYKYKFVELER